MQLCASSSEAMDYDWIQVIERGLSHGEAPNTHQASMEAKRRPVVGSIKCLFGSPTLTRKVNASTLYAGA